MRRVKKLADGLGVKKINWKITRQSEYYKEKGEARLFPKIKFANTVLYYR